MYITVVNKYDTQGFKDEWIREIDHSVLPNQWNWLTNCQLTTVLPNQWNTQKPMFLCISSYNMSRKKPQKYFKYTQHPNAILGKEKIILGAGIAVLSIHLSNMPWAYQVTAPFGVETLLCVFIFYGAIPSSLSVFMFSKIIFPLLDD